MRIGLNLLFLIPDQVGGTETYSRSLINALARIDTANEYFLFVNTESSRISLPTQSNFRLVLCPFKARHRFIRYFWEQTILPMQAIRWRLDLLHSLGYTAPIFLPCRRIVTIHDLNFLFINNFMSKHRAAILNLFVTQAARRTDRVIAVSKIVKEQISEHLKIHPQNISVVYEAFDGESSKSMNIKNWRHISQLYGIHRPYLLALSSYSPHKNIQRLIRAFALLVVQYPNLDIQLVISGHLPKPEQAIHNLSQSLGLFGRIVITGFVAREVLSTLFEHSLLFIFPSLYEGFGLPVLEAFGHGVPVICSKAGSLPEVAGDGAIFFDPYSIEDMARAVYRGLSDADLRETLVKKGLTNLMRFSWDKAAKKTLELYSQVLNKRKK